MLFAAVFAACGGSSSSGSPSTTAQTAGRFEVRPVIGRDPQPCRVGQLLLAPVHQSAVCLTLGATALNGADVASVSVSSQSTDGPGIDIRLTTDGLTRVNALARRLYGAPSPMGEAALLVDGRVFSAPRFNIDHFDATGIRISGSFASEADARHVASAIGPVTASPTSR